MIRIIYLIKKEKRSTFFNATPVLGYCVQRIFSNVERYVNLICQTLVQSAKQCTTTGKIDTVVYNIRIQFGRRIFQCTQMAVSTLEMDFSRQ